MKIVKNKKNNIHSGIVMLFAVFLSTAILSITLGIMQISLKEINFSSSGKDTYQASLAADLGVECALFNDKSTQNKFPVNNSSSTPSITCGSTTLTLNLPVISGSKTTYTFTLPGLGPNGTGCNIIEVEKDTSVPDTVITSKGYNIGTSSNCTSTNLNRLEREYEVHIGGILTPPSPPIPPGNKALFKTFAGSGTGTMDVTSGPSGSSCGTDCLSFVNGASITITANPGSGSTFSSWGGDCGGTTSTCNLTMNSDRFVTANFDLQSGPPPVFITLDSEITPPIASASPLPSVTWSHTVGAGSNKVLVVAVSSRGGTTPFVNTVTYGGIPMTKAKSDLRVSTFSGIWYLISPPSGTADVVVTTGSTSGPQVVQGHSVSLFNVDQTTPVDISSGTNGQSAGGSITTSLVTTTANTFIVDVVSKNTSIANETITMDTTIPTRVSKVTSSSGTNGLRTGISYVNLASSTGTYNMLWTASGTTPLTNWAISGVAFKATASAPPPPGNNPPVANAGTDFNITLSTNSVFTTVPPVDATDSDGTVVSHDWSFISGPTTPSILAPGNKATTFSGMTVAGTYTFRLTATDNLGATGTDDMQVIVSSALPNFPTIAGTSAGSQSVDVSSHPIAFPAGVVSNDLLVVLFAVDGNPTITWPLGWNQMFIGSATVNDRFEGRYKVVTGSPVGINITTNFTEQSAYQSFRITNYTGVPEFSSLIGGNSTTPNPPSLSPSWGSSKGTTWIAAVGRGSGTNITTTGFPANYTNGFSQQAGSTNTGETLDTARRNLTATSEDPGTFTLSAINIWLAATIAIQGL
ncbi:MAG: hypothetical protein Q8O46_03395 [bacterium]|nr:hypothetical protein [bacterium]